MPKIVLGDLLKDARISAKPFTASESLPVRDILKKDFLKTKVHLCTVADGEYAFSHEICTINKLSYDKTSLFLHYVREQELSDNNFQKPRGAFDNSVSIPFAIKRDLSKSSFYIVKPEGSPVIGVYFRIMPQDLMAQDKTIENLILKTRKVKLA